MALESVRVAYIAGAGRSGSTLLERLLGHVPGFLAAGELKNIWHRGFVDNQLCSCGEPFRGCGFWDAVIRRAYGDPDSLSLDRLMRLDRTRNRTRYILSFQFPRLRTRGFARDLADYHAVLAPLYESLSNTSSGTTIIDSSKNIPYALLLSTMSEIELHVIHLVRDSRAVSYSWQKRTRRPEVTARDEYMGGFSPATTALKWDLKNLSAELLRLSAATYTCIRYEDLVAAPQQVVGRLTDRIQDQSGQFSALRGDPQSVPPPPVYHTVSGNPIRLEQRPLTIRPDMEWRTALGGFSKVAATALSFPLLVRYGYFPSES
jgi:hypothetical protein